MNGKVEDDAAQLVAIRSNHYLLFPMKNAPSRALDFTKSSRAEKKTINPTI